MSSPHVAGAVALLLQAKPKTKAADVRGILQNTAEPKPWWGNPSLGFLDNVHRQGDDMPILLYHLDHQARRSAAERHLPAGDRRAQGDWQFGDRSGLGALELPDVHDRPSVGQQSHAKGD